MLEEDLDIFFNPDEHGTRVTFALPGGSTCEISVVFEDSFLNPETGRQSLETTNPLATCPFRETERLRKLLKQANGGKDTIGDQQTPLRGLDATIQAAPGQRFSILQVRPEGTGLAVIVFSRE